VLKAELSDLVCNREARHVRRRAGT
jgi:hypothetical protein